MRQEPSTVVRRMKKSVLTALIALAGVVAWPSAARGGPSPGGDVAVEFSCKCN